MGKGGKVKQIFAKNSWKKVALDQPFILQEGETPFDGLIEFEELTDYHIGDANAAHPESTTEDSTVKPSKKRKNKAEKESNTTKKAKKEIDTSAASPKPADISHATEPKEKPGRKKRKNKIKLSVLAQSEEEEIEVEEDGTDNVVFKPSANGDDDDWETEDERPASPTPEPQQKTVKKLKKKSVRDSKEASVTTEENDIAETTEKNDEDEDDLSSTEKWEQLGVNSEIRRALKSLNFLTPTPVQEQAIPAGIRSRKDIIGAAETGSGKTLAFAIPIVQNIMEDKANEKETTSPYCRAVILTPTRELAQQIRDHIRNITKFTNVTTCLIVGGMFKEKQERLLKRNPDIIIATPGRFFDLVKNGFQYLSSLTKVRYLVIDEADRMVEHGHFHELSDILERMNEDERLAAKRQNFVFSATLQLNFKPEDTNEKHLKKQKGKEKLDKVQSVSELVGIKQNAKQIDLSAKEGTAKSIVEKRIECSAKDKDFSFYYLLMTEATGRTLVFCNSLDCVRRLYGVFAYLLSETGRAPLILHAGMHQKQRLKNLERFTANPKGVLLASDVASRGLDIPDVQYVIHYQVPRAPDLYVHRSGRTGRAFKVGCSVLLIDPSDASSYTKILKNLNREKNFPAVDVDLKLMKIAKERVDLARKIDEVEHSLRKDSSKDEWYLKAADEAGLDLDDGERTQLDISENSNKSKKSKQLRAMKMELKSLLKVPIGSFNVTGYSKRYPALSFAMKQMGIA